MQRWQIESEVRIAEPSKAVEALAIAGDGVQVAAICARSLLVGLLGPAGFPAPLLPTGVITETNSEAVEAQVRKSWETVAWRELGATRQLQWTPDGTALWVAGRQGVLLYNVEGAVVRTLRRWGRVGALTLAPDGDLVIGVGAIVARIDPETGNVRQKFSGHTETARDLFADSDMRGRFATYNLHINAVAVAADGRILSGSDDGTVRLWPVTGSGEPSVFQVDGQVCDACFLDERRAIVASRLGPVFAVDLRTQQRLWSYGEQSALARVRALALSRDRQVAAIARDMRGVHLLDTRTGEPVAEAALPSGAEWAASLCFTRDGSRLVLGTNDGRVALCRAP